MRETNWALIGNHDREAPRGQIEIRFHILKLLVRRLLPSPVVLQPPAGPGLQMHRRGAQCLADISRVAGSNKRVSVSESFSTCRYASTATRGKGKFSNIKPDSLKDVAKIIVKQSKPKRKAAALGAGALKDPLASGRQRPDIFLYEKNEFLSPREDDPWQTDLDMSGEEMLGRYNISRGTYLETRR